VQTEEVDIGLASDLDDSYGSENGDTMDDFFSRNKKAEDKKKMNMTQALSNA